MRKTALLTAVIITVLSVLLPSCRKQEITALYFAADTAAGSFDPQIADDSTARIIVRNCFEGLVTPSENGSVLPAAAGRWETDGLTYTFYLREGSMWHLTDYAAQALEGKLPENFAPEVTAYDFEFGIKRAADPATGSKYISLAKNVLNASAIAAGEADIDTLGVKAVSKYVLQITLEREQPDFLSLLAEPAFMPCNETFFESTGGRYGLMLKYLMFNGPFYMTRFDDSSYRLAQNPAYNGPTPAKADVIWLYTQSSEAAYFESLRDSELAGGYLTPEQAQKFSAGKKDALHPLNDVITGIIINAGSQTLSDKNLRYAFASAADTGEICAEFKKERAESFFPSGVKCAGTYAPADADGKTAAQYLEDGLAELGRESVSVSLLCPAEYETGVRRLLQEWQKILGAGFNISIEAMTIPELRARIQSADYDMALYPVTAPSSSAFDWFSLFSAASGTLTYLENEEYDALAGGLFYDASAEAAVHTQRSLDSEKVFIPLWQDSRYFICTDGVSGVQAFTGADSLYLYNATKDR